MNVGLTFNQNNTRLFILLGFGLLFAVFAFFVVRSVVRTSRSKSTANLSDGDSNPQKKYDPLPLAGELNKVLNEDPSWYTAYSVDCSDLENALKILNQLSDDANFKAVIRTYDARYGYSTSRFINSIQNVTYIAESPKERDYTLKRMASLGLS